MWTFPVLHPNSNFRSVVDLIGVCILAYDMCVTPVVLAWDLTVDRGLLYASYFTTVWWTLDIVLNFRTAFFVHGVLETEPSKVTRNYLRWFPLDALVTSADWFGLVINLLDHNNSQLTIISDFPRFVKMTKVLRLVGVLRIARFVEPLERLVDTYFSQVLHHTIAMAQLLLVVIWVNHLMACTWYGIARQGESDTGLNWTELSLNSPGMTYREAGVTFQYTSAFHWALTQMTPGSMPVHPLNSTERIFNIVCLFLGLLFFSSVISSMTATLAQLKSLHQIRDRTMSELEKFLREKGVSREMSVTVRKQVRLRASQRKPMEIKDVAALKLVSLTVMENLRFELFKGPLRRHQIFRLMDQTDTEMLHRICNTGITVRCCLPEDVLFVQGKVCNEAHLVMTGSVEYTQRSHKFTPPQTDFSPKSAVQGDWLSWAALWSHWHHVGQAQVGPASEVLTLDVVAVMQCVGKGGDLTNFFHQYSLAFHRRLVSAVPPAAAFPNDLFVPFTDFGEIILSIGPNEQKFVGTKALENLEQRSFVWTGMTTQAIQRLQRQILNGRCVIIENDDGQVERVVPITGVRLTSGTGKVLIVLAKKRNGDDEFEWSGQLPAVKQETGELPGQALERIFGEMLRPFAREVRIRQAVREDRQEISDRYRINTTYIRVIYSAKLPDFSATTGPPLPLLHDVKTLSTRTIWHNNSHKWSLPNHEECFLLRDSNSVFVGSWVDPEAENFLRRASKQFRHWISRIDKALLE